MVDKKKKDKGPLQFRPSPETRAKLEKIAEVNGLSVSDVINLALPAGLNMAAKKFEELKAA